MDISEERSAREPRDLVAGAQRTITLAQPKLFFLVRGSRNRKWSQVSCSVPISRLYSRCTTFVRSCQKCQYPPLFRCFSSLCGLWALCAVLRVFTFIFGSFSLHSPFPPLSLAFASLSTPLFIFHCTVVFHFSLDALTKT